MSKRIVPSWLRIKVNPFVVARAVGVTKWPLGWSDLIMDMHTMVRHLPVFEAWYDIRVEAGSLRATTWLRELHQDRDGKLATLFNLSDYEYLRYVLETYREYSKRVCKLCGAIRPSESHECVPAHLHDYFSCWWGYRGIFPVNLP